jgi:hypothetical protein
MTKDTQLRQAGVLALEWINGIYYLGTCNAAREMTGSRFLALCQRLGKVLVRLKR